MNVIRRLFNTHQESEHTVPVYKPLSPCTIEPKEDVDGKKEENKAYIPVSLLIKAIDDRILNIAVAGNYGVGKSSVINTAEQKLKKRLVHKHRFIRISLASLLTNENKFNGKKQYGNTLNNETNDVGEDCDGNSKASTIQQIEYSILQQILYHDNPGKTPKSRIRRIHKTSIWKICWVSLLCVLVVVSLITLINPSWLHLSDYLAHPNASESVKDIILWGPIAILVIASFLLCLYIGRHYTFSLARIGYKDIEMKVKEEMSIFNAFLDEIVYFFESTKYDVVVFEDLDRFEDRETIFYKLRELNTILNNSQGLKRKICFVYAVLDDLFDSTERVKFFDYIITVIPVINSLNSYEKLKEFIQPPEILDKLGRNELWNLCDYFQDMRLLLNIVNEFNQFVPLLDRSVMTEKILFGLIVYKNYVPSDFSKMYNKEGVVAGIIENADKFRQDIIDGKQKEIQGLRESVAAIKDEQNGKEVELRKSLLDKGSSLTNYSNPNFKIRINDEPYLFDSVAKNPELFEKVKTGQAYFLLNTTLVPIPSFSIIEKNMGEANYYEKNLNLIKIGCQNNVANNEYRIQELNDAIQVLPTSIEGIYQSNPDTLEDALNPLIDSQKIKLVKFLILNGYLDRHYQYYISYFYPSALKREDRNFVMRAARYEGKQYDVKLERIDEVLKRFTPQEMESNSALLNIDLVREIYYNLSYSSYRSSLCKLIASTQNLEFICLTYSATPEIKNTFFYELLKTYDFWDDIADTAKDNQDILREMYVRFCDGHKKNTDFSEWLNHNYSFLEKRWDVITQNHLIELFKSYLPVFDVLRLKDTPEYVLDDIIENQRYMFSRQNFSAIIKKLGFYETYSTGAYTAVKNFGGAELLHTVEAHWAEALKFVFPDTSTRECNDALTAILNMPSIPLPEAKSYIAKQRSRIQDVSLLHDDVIDFAFDNSLVEANWKNIYYYVTLKNKLPLTFLYNNTFRQKVGDSLSKQEEDTLCRLIVFTNDVKQTKYEELVPLFTTPFNEVQNNIFPARLKFLVDRNLLAFNPDNFRHIKESTIALSGTFVSQNVDKFMLTPTEYKINNSDAVSALNAISTKKAKCEFIRSISEADFTPESDLGSIVRGFLVDGDLKVGDVGFRLLVSVISTSDNDVKLMMGRRAILSLPYNHENTTALLNAMGGVYKRLTSDSSSSTIPYSRDSIMIINELVENGYVKGCEKKGDKIIVHKQ